MTYSILARDEDGATFGVATASRYLAVGATVPAVAAGIGALATQAETNVLYRESGLRALRRGRTALRTVQLLVQGDPGREGRQVAVVGRAGEPAAWTGADCFPPAGHVVSEDCVAVGNLLANDGVLPAMVEAFGSASGSLAARLVIGLEAGDAAGGDRRGRQSASLLVASGEGVAHLRTPARVDLRVDDHPDPVRELGRILHLHDLLVGEPDPGAAVPLEGGTARHVQELLDRLGVRAGPVDERLATWAFSVNLSHRLLPDGVVDRGMLEALHAEVSAPT